MLLPPLSYRQPRSLSEAVELLDGDPRARVLAGGQTLINALKLGAAEVSLLVDINRLPELKGVIIGDGSIEIGAGVTHDEIQQSEQVREQVPMVASVAAGLVDQQVRCRGTIGGNCCLNDPASNFPPLLIRQTSRSGHSTRRACRRFRTLTEQASTGARWPPRRSRGR